MEVCIRRCIPTMAGGWPKAFRNLDPESIYTRFFSFRDGLSEADHRLIREMDFDNRVALIVTHRVDGREVVIASSSYARCMALTAEVAFIVEEDFHGLGIARRLLAHLGRIAREQGNFALHRGGSRRQRGHAQGVLRRRLAHEEADGGRHGPRDAVPDRRQLIAGAACRSVLARRTNLPIRIRGARTHNLKNINLDLPRNRLIVITGLSGPAKSSLAFDTLYAEGSGVMSNRCRRPRGSSCS